MANSAHKVLIVGAGIGGLGAGAALARRGIETEIVEIKPEPNVYGVGINQPGNALRALDRLGVLDEVCAAGFQFDHWAFHDADGNLVVSCPAGLGGDGIPHHNGLTRRDLHSILIGAAERAGAPVRYATTVTDLSDDNGAAHVTFSDGRQDDYDLVVAFDGINSAFRKRLFAETQDPIYTGFAVWRVTVPRPDTAVGGALFQAVGAKAGYIPLSTDLMYLLLVTPEPHHARYDKTTFHEMLRARLAPFGGIVGEIRDNLRAGDDIVYSPLSEVMLPGRWHEGRVLICGDAAHACTPHLTQGAAMALEDGVVLADELTDDRPLEAALASFTERRQPRVRLVQDASRGILNAEMAVTAENIEHVFEHMRAELPGQMAGLDSMLRRPA
jgi:2-polyprenyl-6-methoxyphenol hydroxylase-like FAD-dependent oxidoreductase